MTRAKSVAMESVFLDPYAAKARTNVPLIPIVRGMKMKLVVAIFADVAMIASDILVPKTLTAERFATREVC